MGRKKEPDRLTQENAMALAAGMSYGKWKALQNPTVIEKPKEPEYGRCIHCGKAFDRPGSPQRKHCNEDCRLAAKNKRKRERREEVCPN